MYFNTCYTFTTILAQWWIKDLARPLETRITPKLRRLAHLLKNIRYILNKFCGLNNYSYWVFLQWNSCFIASRVFQDIHCSYEYISICSARDFMKTPFRNTIVGLCTPSSYAIFLFFLCIICSFILPTLFWNTSIIFKNL